MVTAWRSGFPSWQSRRVNSTIRMLLETTMPTIITMPISDITFSVVPDAKSSSNTPIRPVGTANRIRKGSRKDSNWATRMRLHQQSRKQQAKAKTTEGDLHRICRAAYPGTNILRQLRLRFMQYPFNTCQNPAQIFSLGSNVDVHHSAQLIMIDFGRGFDMTQAADRIQTRRLGQPRAA